MYNVFYDNKLIKCKINVWKTIKIVITVNANLLVTATKVSIYCTLGLFVAEIFFALFLGAAVMMMYICKNFHHEIFEFESLVDYEIFAMQKLRNLP